jgi:hydroxymethylglutaryl-CoA lyase
MSAPKYATLVEVGPRDGFQPIGPLVAASIKIDFIQRLYAAGIRRIEATAFVSARAVPQMADARQILTAAMALPGLDAQVLAPNQRCAEQALSAGANHLAFVLSVSEAHNMSNVRRTPLASAEEYASVAAAAPSGVKLRLNVATAFDCPFGGAVPASQTLALLERLTDINREAEIALCDTTGRATPDHVASLFAACRSRFPTISRWAFHGHDTYGLGVANVLAAWQVGVSVFDASFAGLGGCPFAPGATGNVATEDVVWTLETMGIATGIDLTSLLAVADDGARLDGAQPGGRVRNAIRGARLAGGAAPGARA